MTVDLSTEEKEEGAQQIVTWNPNWSLHLSSRTVWGSWSRHNPAASFLAETWPLRRKLRWRPLSSSSTPTFLLLSLLSLCLSSWIFHFNKGVSGGLLNRIRLGFRVFLRGLRSNKSSLAVESGFPVLFIVAWQNNSQPLERSCWVCWLGVVMSSCGASSSWAWQGGNRGDSQQLGLFGFCDE